MIGTSVTASGPGTRMMHRGPPRRPDSGSPEARKKGPPQQHEFPCVPPGRSRRARAAVSKTDGSYRGQVWTRRKRKNSFFLFARDPRPLSREGALPRKKERFLTFCDHPQSPTVAAGERWPPPFSPSSLLAPHSPRQPIADRGDFDGLICSSTVCPIHVSSSAGFPSTASTLINPPKVCGFCFP